MRNWRDRLQGKQPANTDAGASTISVTMVDAATNRVMGESDLDPTQLPDAFDLSEHSTTMHIGGADWHVENAEPASRTGYVATGRLRLILRRIEMPRSEEILFSLPTLVDALPPVRVGHEADAYALHEDDWRQREFVAATFRAEIAAEFEMIRAARASRMGIGYERLHVRERITEPLAGVSLPLAAVRAAVGNPPRRSVSVGGETAMGGGLVVGGYAFAVDGGVVYGREEQDRVVTLALAEHADAQPLAGLAAEHALVLVDWVRTEAS